MSKRCIEFPHKSGEKSHSNWAPFALFCNHMSKWFNMFCKLSFVSCFSFRLCWLYTVLVSKWSAYARLVLYRGHAYWWGVHKLVQAAIALQVTSVFIMSLVYCNSVMWSWCEVINRNIRSWNTNCSLLHRWNCSMLFGTEHLALCLLALQGISGKLAFSQCLMSN